ncbi:MAG: energy-coupling factor transporter transmembrane protein EcfT [Thermofilaceae archaeon]|nr:energy-coupling factor transporter transmembrane protein EcfT [Thermofilaceae archaeon]MCX8179908.1 energy-coupling factor transporter transmembrane protein EcfT [Thermofilaceae archaeon]MDW8004401.1 energy-coupling factor transporter transmembrane component T [Thermofilaceae archaeon]
MKRRRTTDFLLNEAFKALNVLAEEKASLFSPGIALASAFTVSLLVSFSDNFASCAAALVGGAIFSKIGKGFKAWFGIVAATFVFSSLATFSPYAFTPLTSLSQSTVEQSALTVARAASAASALAGILSCIGLNGFLSGLNQLRAPRQITDSITVFLKYLPIFVRNFTTFIAAREARQLKPGYSTWTLTASAVGELMLRGFQRARLLSLALEARSFSPPVKTGQLPPFSSRDLAPLAYTLSVAVTFLLV